MLASRRTARRQGPQFESGFRLSGDPAPSRFRMAASYPNPKVLPAGADGGQGLSRGGERTEHATNRSGREYRGKAAERRH